MMLVHGLRLLVAIITFVVGVGAGRLFGSESRPCGKRVYSYAPVHVAAPVVVPAPSFDAPPPRPHGECSINRSSRVVSGGVLNGKAVSKPAPVYPPAARAAGVVDTVVVQIQLGEDGCVTKAEAIGGHSLLRGAAEEAARVARFSPTLLGGEPVRVSGVVTYNFVP